VTTVLHWAVSFIGRGRSQRTTTHDQITGRRRLAKAEAEVEAAKVAADEPTPTPTG